MLSQGKNNLKKSPLLVKIARSVRQVGPTWQKISRDLEQEALFQHTIIERDRIIAAYLEAHPVKKLQIGAGTNPLSGWLNTDHRPETDEISFLDATRPFPFAEAQFDFVFSEHMIEHIHYKEGIFMMQEVYRVLKPGGKVRIATPDIQKIVGLFAPEKTCAQRQYIEWKAVEFMGLYSPQRSRLQERRPEWDIDNAHVRKYYPNTQEDGVCFIVNQFFRGYGHQFLYDVHSLSAILQEAGFKDIRRCKPGESDDSHLRGLESHASMIGNEMNEFETMVLEGIRSR